MRAWLEHAEPLDLVLRASLLVVLVNSNDDLPTLIAVAAVTLVGLPRPNLLRNPYLWAGLFAAIGARQLMTWHHLDDHVIATTYWCGAIALALRAADPLKTLALGAQLLIGTLFAFAAGWKLATGQFLDGTFFRYTLVFDDRFTVLGRVIGGTTDAMREADLRAVTDLLHGGGAKEVVLQEGRRAPQLANALSWWGVAVELAVAVTHLVPKMGRGRHLALIAFAATTYLVVPVSGFSTLLLVLGAAQATTARGRTAYLAGAAVALVYGAIWPAVFL